MADAEGRPAVPEHRCPAAGQFRSLLLCRLIPLETQPGWNMPAKTAPSGPVSVESAASSTWPHTTWGRLSGYPGSQGKPALVGGVTMHGHQVSVWSRAPPILNLSGLFSQTLPRRHRMLRLSGQAVLRPHAQTLLRVSVTWLPTHHAVVLIQYPSQTQRKELRTAPFHKGWDLSLLAPRKADS